jgi:glycosyltransferase involved in cell wall biosynthesis
MGLTPRDFRARAWTLAYLAKRLVIGGETRRFAPTGLPVFDPNAPAEQGVVDSVSEGVVRGWCRSLDQPDATASVDIYVDEMFVGRTVCDLDRPDLRVGKVGHGRYGFRFALGGGVVAAGGAVRVMAAASGLELRGSPFRLHGSAIDLETAPESLRRAVLHLCQTLAPNGGATSLDAQRRAYGGRLEGLGSADPAFADAGWPVTQAMSYVNARFHKGAKPVHGAQAYFHLLRVAADHFTPATAGLPMGSAQIEALGAPGGWLMPGRVRATALLDLYMHEHSLGAVRDEAAAASTLAKFCYDILVRRRLPIELLGESAREFLAARADAHGWSRLERASADLPMLDGLGLSGRDERLAAAAALAQALGLGPASGREQAPVPLVSDTLAPGLTIVGSGEGAISMNARHSAAALDRLGIAHRTVSIPLWKRSNAAVQEALSEAASETLLLHVQPDDAVEVIVRLPPQTARSRLIGFFMWETETLPAAHELGALLVDEIWTGSEYCAEVFRKAAPHTPVHAVGHGVEDGPEAPGFDARQWAGCAPGDYLFYTHFDARSWITRKNPVAAVRAFHRAFPDPACAARLLIKVRIPQPWAEPDQEPWWSELYEEAARDPRIRVVEADLDPGQMAELARAADAFISLHRAEGFGYGIAEAMLAGKPVVISDYSGPCDFAGEAEALLVPVTRRPVRSGEFLYGDPTQVWGEPDIDAAAAAMRTLYEDRAFGLRLGRHGQVRIRRDFSIEALARRYADLLAAKETFVEG